MDIATTSINSLESENKYYGGRQKNWTHAIDIETISICCIELNLHLSICSLRPNHYRGRTNRKTNKETFSFAFDARVKM